MTLVIAALIILGSGHRILPGDIDPKTIAEDEQQFMLVRVKSATNITTEDEESSQTLVVTAINGTSAGQDLTVENTLLDYGSGKIVELHSGELAVVVAAKTDAESPMQYFIYEQFRLPWLLVLALIFVWVVFAFTGWRGITAVAGLIFSVLVLMIYLVPNILSGANPLLVALTGSMIITCFSLYLAHGWNTRTTISLISTLISIVLALGSAVFVVNVLQLLGTGSEDATYLRTANLGNISLQGLLLAGIIIGTLGVLDDVTTAQTATVAELHHANNKLDWLELYKRGLSVGREHITSLVNTLVLAYVGASLPLVLLFTVNTQIPLWVTLNSEVIAEEVARTLVGSATLVLAVPIATLLAALYYSKKLSLNFN